ncbi:MAG: D-alanyl-D-alanine carboxypeptidase, partial [Chloroflexi bacterium]|nr:D-alanyl-D-alanine carboxypeptidase [Chloroflexota bacterium]
MTQHISRRRWAQRPSAALLAVVLASAPGVMHASSSAAVGVLPSGAQKVMDKEAYSTARWLYDVVDASTGEVLLSQQAGQMVFTGSTAKNFTIGAAYALLGPDSRVTTPVYATAPVSDGALDGDLVLVASGDLALGGRGALQGRFTQAFTATTIDHVYGDLAPNAVKNAEDPLAGLDSLATQVVASGVSHIKGDVVIDDRLWKTEPGQEGPVPPIYVNDNILDITVTPASVGATASADGSPTTSAYDVVSTVATEAGSDVSLAVAADPANPRLLTVSGTIGADAGPHLAIYRISDAASWARTLFIEALGRAGVTVDADPTARNQTDTLPAQGTYGSKLQLASLTSPPLRAIGAMILETSYNTGANAVLCLLAVHA